jgi:hypothetical protein
VHLLALAGWHPHEPCRWVDVYGVEWSFPNRPFPHSHVVNQLQDHLALQLCRNAANHYGGCGLAVGLECDATTSLVRHARKKHDVPLACGLESIMSSACWSSTRVHDAYPDSEHEVCECGGISPDDLHTYWTCPLLDHHAHADVRGTSKYVQLAVEQIHTYPCLWTRGLLPIALVAVNAEPLDAYPLCNIVPVALGLQWPSGCMGSDASGCSCSSIPSLRIIGVGLRMLSPISPHSLAAGVCTMLPGPIQTVPRGELLAILLLLKHWAPGCCYHVFSDSEVYINFFYCGRNVCLACANGYLWSEWLSILASEDIALYLGFLPSHIEAGIRARSNGDRNKVEKVVTTSLFAIAHNGAADLLAGHAATKGELSVQRRLYCILCTKKKRIVLNAHVGPSQEPSLDVLAASSSHSILFYRGRAQCRTCASSLPLTPKGVVRDWLASHNMYVYKGFFFCMRCGNRRVEKFHLLSHP